MLLQRPHQQMYRHGNPIARRYVAPARRHACHRAPCRGVPWRSRAIPSCKVDEEPKVGASLGATFLSQADHAKAYGPRRLVTSRSPYLSPWKVRPILVMFDFRVDVISATLARVEKDSAAPA